MAVEWNVGVGAKFDSGALLVRLSGVVASVSGWQSIDLSWYIDRSAYLRGDRERGVVTALSPGDAVVLGDHLVGCYVEVALPSCVEDDSLAWETSYCVAARREPLSHVMALLTAACLAESGPVNVFDEGRITGRRLVPPADILRPVSFLPLVDGETVDSATHRVARAVGAESLASSDDSTRPELRDIV